MVKKLLLLNGPNLNLLGTREPAVYGCATLADIEHAATAQAVAAGATLSCFQSNHEGALIDRIHAARTEGVDFIVINPGGLTHTSVALRDAFASVAPDIGMLLLFADTLTRAVLPVEVEAVEPDIRGATTTILDGTKNFTEGIPHFAVSVALMDRATPPEERRAGLAHRLPHVEVVRAGAPVCAHTEADAVAAHVPTLVADRVASRLFAMDHTLWGEAAEAESAKRLSWTGLPRTSRHLVGEVSAMRDELSETGYDRVVWQFPGSGPPSFQVHYVDTPLGDGSGDPVDVAGDAYLEVVVKSLGYPDSVGACPPDATRAKLAGTVFAEANSFCGGFEGVGQSFVGVRDRQRPFKVAVLTNPTRLVVDVYSG